MILGDSPNTPQSPGSRATLDDLFRRAAARRPDALALIDPPDRETITGDPPRRLSYAQADRMVSAIAGRLRRLDLPTDAVIGIQLPNVIESVLTLLGALRAGMIAAPLPLLWRQADCASALVRLGAKTLIVCGRVGATDHGELARHVAAEAFTIRHVGGFGRNLPDGVVPLDDLYAIETPDPLPVIERSGNPAAHVAAITWDVTADGLIPVGRNHAELLAGGMASVLESQWAQDGVILSSMPAHSFAGLALTVSQWLFTGGTLVLHHGFDPELFAAQCREFACDLAVLPGPVLGPLAEIGFLDPFEDLKAVLAVWRAPERLTGAAPWHNPQTPLVDILVFGETAIVPARRSLDGRPAAIPLGVVTAPRSTTGGIPIAEIRRSEQGTILLRGGMVPHHPYPLHAERGGAPHLRIAPDGFVDSGYGCGVDPATRQMTVTGAPPGIVSVGGYRFRLRDLQDLVAGLDGAATLTALPDAFAGHRLAGSAADPATLRQALAARGVNPLLIRAFRDRPVSPAASA